MRMIIFPALIAVVVLASCVKENTPATLLNNTVPGDPDFSQYNYALIHCKQYNHRFGSAGLR